MRKSTLVDKLRYFRMPTLKELAIAGFMTLGSVFASSTANAQGYTVSGVVRDLNDQVSGNVLSGARLEVNNGESIAFSGADGTYTLNNVRPGVDTIKVTMPGYKGFFESAINITGNTTLRFSLPSVTQVTDMGTDTVRAGHLLALYIESMYVPKEPVYWRNLPINICLQGANSYDSTQANNALGFGDWHTAPVGSVARHLKRNMYNLVDKTTLLTTGGVMLAFHAPSNTSSPFENSEDPGYFIYGSSEVSSSGVRFIQHEVAGWCLSKGPQTVFPSNMNEDADYEYTLEDVVLTWVAENH